MCVSGVLCGIIFLKRVAELVFLLFLIALKIVQYNVCVHVELCI